MQLKSHFKTVDLTAFKSSIKMFSAKKKSILFGVNCYILLLLSKFHTKSLVKKLMVLVI